MHFLILSKTSLYSPTINIELYNYKFKVFVNIQIKRDCIKFDQPADAAVV